MAAGEGLDDTHRTTALRACLVDVLFLRFGLRIVTCHLIRLRCLIDQMPYLLDPVAADTVGEEARVSDAVEARRQDMDQKAANELGYGQAHDLHPITAFDAVVFPAEGHRVAIGIDEPVVGDRHPVRIAAQICQHGLGPVEGWFGISDVGHLRWEREDHVEVFDGQKVFDTSLHPFPCRSTLALRAMPVAAGIIGDVLVATLGASRHMPAEGGGPASFDRRHHLELRQVQVSGMVLAIVWPMGAEDLRTSSLGRGMRRACQPVSPFRRTRRSSGLVTSRIVLVATLV